MIRLIWQSWWRRKERFLLLLFGALIISAGLSYLIGLSETSKGTIVDELQKRWSASYHIVVRPEGSRSLTEADNLLDPNYLSGLDGGISLAQYEQIKAIENIEVAAPIAMIGYGTYNLYLDNYELEDEGIYRLIEEEVINDGITEKRNETHSYFTYGNDAIVHQKFIENEGDYFLGPIFENIVVVRSILFAGIDPEQEAKLIGLDKAILQNENNHYFTKEDVAEIKPLYDSGSDDVPDVFSFPVIFSNTSYTDLQTNYTIEKLDLPFDKSEASTTLERAEENGGRDYLDKQPGTVIRKYTYDDQEVLEELGNSMSGYDMVTGDPVYENRLKFDYITLDNHPSQFQYKQVDSPFQERWPYAYEIEVQENEGMQGAYEGFRKMNSFIEDGMAPLIAPYWIGFYDPTNLDISKDPLNELPMETYRPASAELVLDGDRNPVNPPETLKPEVSPDNFLANPPGMLTTIEAAEMIRGDQPISAIRVKVAGVSELTEDSQETLDLIAREIEEKTGLLTDITLGSSPQPALTNIPSINGKPEYGWLQQMWVKLGSSFTLFKEAKIGYTGIIFSVIVVASLYVWASSFVSLLARRNEFAVMAAVGWRPSQISRLLVVESALLGVFVAAVSWTIIGFVYLTEDVSVSPLRFLATGIIAFIIYIIGAVVPALMARNISPYLAMQTGEISISKKRLLHTRGILSMSANHFLGKWKRSWLSIITIALPTSLLALFIYVGFRLKGVMYTTWLGQYVALEVGPIQYIAIIIALVIAVLTTFEITWQNVAERGKEIAILKSVGWKNGTIRKLIWSEGLFTGICAAVLSLLLAFGAMWIFYGEIPFDDFGMIVVTALVPIIVGVLGTVIPAEKAARLVPMQGLVGQFGNEVSEEKWMRKFIITVFAVLLLFVIYTAARFILSI
ncbi:FtsX-like permease family protein [Sporosarcina sp. OR05]|uniref:ABC transporter permease n=1 Tax=Sporosarcina sp. OR05 TaxID=2969819 RepID=UPI00352BB72A